MKKLFFSLLVSLVMVISLVTLSLSEEKTERYRVCWKFQCGNVICDDDYSINKEALIASLQINNSKFSTAKFWLENFNGQKSFVGVKDPNYKGEVFSPTQEPCWVDIVEDKNKKSSVAEKYSSKQKEADHGPRWVDTD